MTENHASFHMMQLLLHYNHLCLQDQDLIDLKQHVVIVDENNVENLFVVDRI
jgi:hypothetical protein